MAGLSELKKSEGGNTKLSWVLGGVLVVGVVAY